MTCECGKNPVCQCAPISNEGCTPAYNNCNCSCHRMPGVSHVVACCGTLPQSEQLFGEDIFNLDSFFGEDLFKDKFEND